MRLLQLLVCLAVGLVGSIAWADRIDELNHTVVSEPAWRVRLQAVMVLGRLGDKRAVPALVHALTDQAEGIRGLAAQILGKLGDPRAVPGLERARHDASGFVREKATEALSLIHPASLDGSHVSSTSLHIEIGGIG